MTDLTWNKAKNSMLMTFGAALLTLLGWLLIGQSNIQRDVDKILTAGKYEAEKSIVVDRQIERLVAMDQLLAKMLNDLQIQAASHGWEMEKP